MIAKKLQKNRGFTLMETMVYIALFSVLMTGAVVGTYNLLEGGEKNVEAAGIQEEGTFINRKISYALSGAENVTITGGGNTLNIDRADFDIQISTDGNYVTFSRDGGLAIQLNSDRFPVSNLNFVYTASVNGRPPSVASNFKIMDREFTFKNYLRQ